MSLFSTILTALSLSMDAFAVSVTKGMTLKKIDYKIATKIAFSFGFFQAIMPLIGWMFGIRFESYIKSIDHWIAVVLLSFIGIKMIIDAKDDDNSSYSTTIDNKELFILSIATSIDALAIGVIIGKKIGSMFKTYAQIFGGVILILIGFNILNEHTGIISKLFGF